jgi:RimJ/RimL family protein N-acetyltransferase
MRNSPKIRDWCREHTDISQSQQSRWAEKIENDPSIKMFSIMVDRDYLDEDNKPLARIDCQVGVCGFTSIDKKNGSAEFSCYIGEDYQRQGFARKALKTLFKHGFDDWGFHRIWGETFDGNPALDLFLSLGMQKVGTNRQAYWKKGRFIDAHIIDILSEEFDGNF